MPHRIVTMYGKPQTTLMSKYAGMLGLDIGGVPYKENVVAEIIVRSKGLSRNNVLYIARPVPGVLS
jgi:hypothetical protein